MGKITKKTSFSIGKPGEFITDSEAVYVSDSYNEVRVPAGFPTDFASIPHWVPRWLFDPMRHARWAALFHDYLCRQANSYKKRVAADHVFLECMTDQKVKSWRRYTMFSAVRANTYRMRIMRYWK